MNTTSPEKEYERIWAGYTDEDILPPKLARAFYGKVKRETLRSAFPHMGSYGRHVRNSAKRMIGTAQRHNMFDVHVEGEDELANADLILGNHQGPNEGSGNQGGIETILGCALAPDQLRIVLKSELVRYRWRIKDIVRSRALRKGKPIIVERPDRGVDRREYAVALGKEIERISHAVFDTIDNSGNTVMMYPEGTRSHTGEILPLMTRFFQVAIQRYVIPRMQKKRDMNIGISTADTLQVFPEGFGGTATMYRRSMTIRGIRYNTSALEEKIHESGEPIGELSMPTIKRLGNFFAADVRACMQRELCEILQQS